MAVNNLRVAFCAAVMLLFPVLLRAQAMALDWPALRADLLAQNPLARRAALLDAQAEAALLRARGGFDPKLYAGHEAKRFDGTTYFQHSEAGVTLPTWAGLELKASYNTARGTYVNPENRLPEAGQAALGLTWSLGQGLRIDERRAELRLARAGMRLGAAQRDAGLNDLLFRAASDYWAWVAAANQLAIYEEALRQARVRHEGLRQSFRQGDKPGIDTVETFIQVQTREMDMYLARLDVQNTALALQNFTALPAVQAPPLDLPVVAAPDPSNLVEQSLRLHPEIRGYAARLEQLDVERRLKLEKRKPLLDASYYFLGAGWSFFPSAAESNGRGVLANDAKWQVRASYPLLNRKARGDYQLTTLKIAQTELELAQKRRDIETKVRQYANELQTLQQQLTVYNQQVARFRQLLDAELEKFRYGESSVFLINTREQRWLDALIKFQKLLAEYKKAEAGLQWAAGTL
jgi:outer membrane protein TolC